MVERIDRYSLTPKGFEVAQHLVFLSHLPKFIRIFFEWYDDISLAITCLKDFFDEAGANNHKLPIRILMWIVASITFVVGLITNRD